MEYRNAIFISETVIDCEINHEVHGWIPYTLNPDDTDQTVDNVALRASIGSDVGAYIPPSASEKEAQLASNARSERSGLLSETDWAGQSDVIMSAEMTTYRQALRDVPQQSDFPDNINWPTAP
jgi:agmatine/peptidylarginine deiminase